MQEIARSLRHKSRRRIKAEAHNKKCANMRAAKERKRRESLPPERHKQIIERMAICLVTWVGGKSYMRMMRLDPDGKASFRITAAGKLMATREGPVTSLSGATTILRKRAVTFRNYT